MYIGKRTEIVSNYFLAFSPLDRVRLIFQKVKSGVFKNEMEAINYEYGCNSEIEVLDRNYSVADYELFSVCFVSFTK